MSVCGVTVQTHPYAPLFGIFPISRNYPGSFALRALPRHRRRGASAHGLGLWPGSGSHMTFLRTVDVKVAREVFVASINMKRRGDNCKPAA